MRASDEIRIEQRGALVVVTLNRPRALNALSFEMCRAIHEGLASWQADPDVHAVLIKGSGERAFCAGGDIRWLYDALISEGIEPALAFYALEYPMNARLHHFSKPYVALLDGITMGGGVGVSVHGSHRIVTERTVFAMPETGIGFFPDVGATYVLPRLGGALGMYLGLSGARLGAADCVWTGLGSCYVRSQDLEEVEARLAEADLASDPHGQVQSVLDDLRADPGPAALGEQIGRIDACYGRSDLGAVLHALGAEETGWGHRQLEQLSTKSPTSLAVSFRQLQEGARLSFDDAMRLEYRLVPRFLDGHDFREGIRALIVDKDGRPDWRPSRLEDVAAADVDAYFRPLPGGDLQLDGLGAAG
jgi:enoyl-CoA hydratase